MSIQNWTFDDGDQRAADDLKTFLPARMFDIHAHVYRTTDLSMLKSPHMFLDGPKEVTIEVWREHLAKQVGGASRLQGGLFIPVPMTSPEQIDGINRFALEQTAKMPLSKALGVVSPELSPDQFRPLLKNPQFAGFKPYHVYSPLKPTWQAPLNSFLPEWVWQLAHEHGLVITLHMVRDGALADPDNQREIRAQCLKYPNARLILAHAARGFHAPNTIKGVSALRGLQNVWFDTSAICEAAPLKAILDEFGPRKLIWGSDFPVSELRGKAITMGDGFIWIMPDNVLWDTLKTTCRPVLLMLECLRAVREAAEEFGLNAEDLQDIFADNALRLLGAKKASGNQTETLYQHAKQRIPGGTQLLSKRPEMQAPDQWPAYFREARGCETWDLDGRHYYDFSTNGIGACLLGFRDPDVTRAVKRRINLGSMCTLNPPEEVELADLLCEIHPWAEQVRFARCGGEACAVAVRIARATTDRSIVAICGYSGWQDWYLAANLGESDALRGHLLPGLSPLGVPRELRGTTLAFTFNNREELAALLQTHGDRLAAVVMEPCRSQDPAPGFLEFVRDGAQRVGALLVFDEISIGWRLHFGGAHLKFGVNPDLAVFSKAMGNGHPVAAIIGTRAAMAGAHGSFISSTYWTESVGPVAALATIRKLQAAAVPARVAQVGRRVQALWAQCGQRHGLPLHVGGYPCLAHFRFDHEKADALRTLYTQYMLGRGFLAGTGLYPTLAHTDAVVERYGEAIDEVFGQLSQALASGDVEKRLRGPVAHTGFRRLTG